MKPWAALFLLQFHSLGASALVAGSGRKIRTAPLSAVKESTIKETSQHIIIAEPSAETPSAMAKLTTPVAATKPKATKRNMRKSNNLRWALRGIVGEIFHNVFIRNFGRLQTRLFTSKQQRLEMENALNYRQPPKHEIAVVTGATGGIGSQIAHSLALRGYDVVVAARDAARGEALVNNIRGVLKATPVRDGEGGDLPTISFVEYHADVPGSALDVASAVEGLASPARVLINNAGIMGKSKQLTMKVNLLGPAMLTFAMLPLMAQAAKESESNGPPTVINVGSSAHLRATHVIDEGYLSSIESDVSSKSWIESLSEEADEDLSVYAQSKLALMQFTTLLRHWLPKIGASPSGASPIRVYDAHPGLVWTPLLRNHIGDKAVGTLTRTGLANLIYKSSSEGAQAIVSALDYSAPSASEQVYFVNGRAGGYAASESTSLEASMQLWKHVLAPEVGGIVTMPNGWGGADAE